MINYSKVRESVEKTASKKSLGRSNNKSHTSSINIKLGQETAIDQIKIPMRGAREKGDSVTGGKTQIPSGHKKYSVKLQSHQKENQAKKRQTHPYDVTIFRPFQDSNRYLQTERLPKQFKMTHQRTPSKQPLRLRTDYNEQKHIKTDYTETTPQKYRKQPSTKHATQNSNKIIRVPLDDLKRLMGQLIREQKQVKELKKEVAFYREHAGQGNGNPVLRSLRF